MGGLAAAECAVAAGLGAEERADTAGPQPAASAASRAIPAAGRINVNDMACPFMALMRRSDDRCAYTSRTAASAGRSGPIPHVCCGSAEGWLKARYPAARP